ncbi:MAG: peptidoglycan D,D-transpeptidase FtsI family protein [Acidimicrobiales bacterium]
MAIGLAFVAVIGRLAFVQGLSARQYAEIGLSERIHTVDLAADRGSIFDRNGNHLAMSVPQATIWADPRLVTAPAQEAAALAPVLKLDEATVLARLSKSGAFAYIARTVDDTTAAQVKALNLPGISMLNEPKRFLPDGDLAEPVVGQVGTDDTGLSGLEFQYQRLLAGHSGRLVSEDDPSGKPIPGGLSKVTPASPGSDLILTIDQSLQYEVQQQLSNQILATKAKGGMAVVMDTHTGEVLAMSSLVQSPDGSGVVPSQSNSVLTTVYEPGSVQKLITISAALESHVVEPSTVLPISDTIQVSDGVFHDDTSHPLEHWSVTDILTASSNVGTITIGRALGKERINTFLHRYGLGTRTSLHYPGESPGLLPAPANWSGTTIATVPIGQGIANTAIQVITAYNAIANGGVYVAPKLVKAVVDGHGRSQPTPPSATHRVVSPQTAREMTAMLSEVVRTGTATAAQINGYTVSGKTGTARKTIEGQSGYVAGAYVASFAGFVPAERPAFTAMVVLDQPTPIFGGLASAPVFQKIASYALRELHIPPQPPDPGLFAGVPHAALTVSTAADEPTNTARAVVTPPVAPPVGPATTATTAPGSPAPLSPPGGSPPVRPTTTTTFARRP